MFLGFDKEIQIRIVIIAAYIFAIMRYNPSHALTLVFILFTFSAFSQLKVQTVNFNRQITGFSQALELNGMLVYLPNGKADLEAPHPSCFSLRVKNGTSIGEAKSYLNFVKDAEIRNGETLTDVVARDTVINGLSAYIITMREQFRGKKTRAHNFYACICKGGDAVIYLSSDLDNEKYYSKLVKTFYSIKL